MNIKPIFRYQLREYYKVFSVFYSVIYGLIVLTLIFKYTRTDSDGAIFGMEFSTMVACFVTGLVLFKSVFRFCTACGVSRRRLFFGLTAAIAVSAAVVSLIDIVNVAVFSNFIDYRTFYSSVTTGHPRTGIIFASYSLGSAGKFTLHLMPPLLLLKNWLWCLLADFGLMMLGFLIGVLYYRMSKPVKILVSVGVPAICFIFLPLLDVNVTHGRITRSLAGAWTQWTYWGLNPGFDLLSRLAATALIAGGVWLLLRKAEVFR